MSVSTNCRNLPDSIFIERQGRGPVRSQGDEGSAPRPDAHTRPLRPRPPPPSRVREWSRRRLRHRRIRTRPHAPSAPALAPALPPHPPTQRQRPPLARLSPPPPRPRLPPRVRKTSPACLRDKQKRATRACRDEGVAWRGWGGEARRRREQEGPCHGAVQAVPARRTRRGCRSCGWLRRRARLLLLLLGLGAVDDGNRRLDPRALLLLQLEEDLALLLPDHTRVQRA